MAEIEDLVRVATKRNASDIHIQVGLPPVLRIQTRLIPVEAEKLTPEDTQRLVYSMMSEAAAAHLR